MTVKPFFTAFDPSDLPGGSIDPLGFDSGYTYLADRILPGLTNVASQPRYISMMCAAIHLADVSSDLSPRTQYAERLNSILKLERLWALAHVIDDPEPGIGIRGITYATAHFNSLQRKNKNYTNAEYQLLSRQIAYGAVGIYGAVADGMKFFNRKTFSLTPGLGEPLAKAFIEETRIPESVINAVKSSRISVPILDLHDWLSYCHIKYIPSLKERECIHDALIYNPIRAKMAGLAIKYPFQEGEEEIARLKRISRAIKNDSGFDDLYKSIQLIILFENSYRLAQLALERLIFICRHEANASLSELSNDNVINYVTRRLPENVRKLHKYYNQSDSRINNTVYFLDNAAEACSSCKRFIDVLIHRHKDVQHGKFDRGRRKTPWIECSGQRLHLISTRVGGLHFEAKMLDDISPHPYRLTALDEFCRVGGNTE